MNRLKDRNHTEGQEKAKGVGILNISQLSKFKGIKYK